MVTSMPPFRSIALSLLLIATPLLLRGGEPVASVHETDDAIVLKHGKRTILQFNKSVQVAPSGIDPINNRSGYIHPIFTPAGKVASGDFSEDHPHQHGLFMAWTRAVFKGERIDFWNPKEKTGRIEFVKTAKVDKARASFSTHQRYVATAQNQEIPVIDETWTVTARQASGKAFVFDVESRQRLIGKEPLVHEQYRYGGMALRGSNEWTSIPDNTDGTCDFLTSEGDAREAGNHTKVRWVRMSGEIKGDPASLVVLTHPSNFRSPQAVRLHPKMPYFVFSPMVEDAFTIEPDEDYVSRYRYLVTDDVADPDWINAQWTEFAKATLD